MRLTQIHNQRFHQKIRGASIYEDPDFSTCNTSEPRQITQAELNYLVQDFGLPKTRAHVLGSLLKQSSVLVKGVSVSFYRKRQSNIATYYSIDGDVWCGVL
jgi:DNA gyrase/topoisomerase IV subunit B